MAATSASEGKRWLGRVLENLASKTPLTSFLDIGTGEGTYSDLYKAKFGGHWTGVEIFEPYIERHNLRAKYDNLLIADAREPEIALEATVAFCGDVLEHMTKDDALALHARLMAACDYVVISIPIIDFPQEEEEGNAHQAHLATWDHDAVMSSFEGIQTYYKGQIVGVYVASAKHKIDIPNHIFPKIAVYAIAKNEKQHVNRMIGSCLAADAIVIADTGSTDGTYEAIQAWQESRPGQVYAHRISVSPWRFDVARNAALALVPDDIDYCISVDLDEGLAPDWRERFEAQVKYWYTRILYRFQWSQDLVFWGDKAHARHGYIWRHPVHETINPVTPEFIGQINFTLWQDQDTSKPRSQYLPLLEQSCRETPTYGKNSLYLGREYFFYNRYNEAITELQRYLTLEEANWNPDRSSALRFIAESYEAIGEQDNAALNFQEAANTAPEMAENWLYLAGFAYRNNDWHTCLYAARQASEIEYVTEHYLYNPEAYGAAPWDYRAIAAYNIGVAEKEQSLIDEAIFAGNQAVAKEPENERLNNNLFHYQNTKI